MMTMLVLVLGAADSVCSDLIKGGVAGGVGGSTGETALLVGTAGGDFLVTGFGDITLEFVDRLVLGSLAIVFAFVTPALGLGDKVFELWALQAERFLDFFSVCTFFSV